MPNLPISQLPSAGSLNGAELFAIVQGGVTKNTTLNSITYIQGNNYGLFNQTGPSTPFTGSGTTAQGSLIDGGVGTLSVPANGFTTGDAYYVVLTGQLSVENNHTLEIRIKANNIVLADTGVIQMSKVTDKRWRLEVNFSINNTGAAGVAEIATAGTFQYRQDASNTLIGEIFSTINSSSFDTTIPNTLAITAEWGLSSTSADTIFSKICTLTKTF